MKAILLKTIIILAALACYSLAAEKNVLTLTVDPEQSYQTIDGFGASDAWRAQFVGRDWPLEKRNRIADLLFSREFDEAGNPEGIGLSIWRFYLSGGSAEQGRASGIGNVYRRGECFMNEDGSLDWTKQQGQQWFLRAAKERGVEKLLMFPNAAPVYLSRNGKAYAEKGDIRLNLKPDCYDDYASFIVDVLEHFGEEGLPFDYISPVNEPQWGWDDGGQEGTPALNTEIYKLVRCLSQELGRRKLGTRIIIGEAGTIGHAALDMSTLGEKSDGRDNQARFFFGEKSDGFIGALDNVEKTISAHSYFSVWPVDKQVSYRERVAAALKDVDPDLGYWMSEYCILQKNDELGGGNGRDLTMKTALYVARIIHNDLTITNAKSWQWWTAITQCDYKDGLVYLDDGSQNDTGRMGPRVESLRSDGAVRESKLLWVLGNYSRFVRPQMVRIACSVTPKQSVESGVLASAYKDPNTGDIVLVLTNLLRQDVSINAGGDRKVKTYTTDESRDMGFSVWPLNSVSVPARSVVTVLWEKGLR